MILVLLMPRHEPPRRPLRGDALVLHMRREEEVIDFNTAYRVRLPAVARCRIVLGSEKMEEVSLNIWEQYYVSMGEWKGK